MSVFGKIATADTIKEAWDILEKTYKGIDRVQQNNLMILKSNNTNNNLLITS